MCVCGLCVFSSHSFWTSNSLDVPAGVTQEEGHAGFFIHLLSAVRALIFLARRMRPFLSLVDREVEFCVLTISSFSTRRALAAILTASPAAAFTAMKPKQSCTVCTTEESTGNSVIFPYLRAGEPAAP